MKILKIIGNILAAILLIPTGIVAAVAITAVLLILLVIAVPARLVYSLWTEEPFLDNNRF